MFNLKAKFLLAAAVLVVGASAASAQIGDGSIIKVSVPNAFILNDETFEAGLYTIERTPSTIDSPSLLILRGEGDAIIFDTMVSRTNGASSDTKLVFDTVGSTNYLSAIQVKGQDVESQIVKTKAQSRAVSQGQAVQTTITITNTGF